MPYYWFRLLICLALAQHWSRSRYIIVLNEGCIRFLNAIVAGLAAALPILLYMLTMKFDDSVFWRTHGWSTIQIWTLFCLFASLFSALCLWLINRRWPPRDASGAAATRP